MSDNDRMLVDQEFQRWQNEWQNPLPDDRAFEFFACEQVLKELDVSTEEVGSGLVGGGGDGAIDGIYIFVDGQLLADDSEIFDEDFSITQVRRDVDFTLHLVQAKRSESFTENTIDLVSSSTRRLLDLTQDNGYLRSLYSEEIIEKVGLFRNALAKLAPRHPTVSIEFCYVTRGDTDNIHPRVKQKAGDLEQQLSLTLPGAKGAVTFLGAAELWTSATTAPSYTLNLTYQENATSGNSHIALIRLRDYHGFLSAEDGTLRRHIFDWNVRDYQGQIEVNREIRSSLEDPSAPDFWWLNNGVTIICSRVSIQSKTYTLDDVQIVNGLQTSQTIFDALSELDSDNPVFDHTILVRILETEDPATRDRVIRATNRQTSVSEASLRATDAIQREIESYFESNGWYYDRRKNYYRNLGKPAGRIVGIPLLAQSIMAIGLSRPNDARARPSSLLKTEENYKTIFSDRIPLVVYLWAAKIQREVDAFLQSDEANTSNPERTNLRFHLAMLATARLFRGRVHAPEQLRALAESERKVAEADLPACILALRSTMQTLVGTRQESPDKIAKGREFVEAILSGEGFSES